LPMDNQAAAALWDDAVGHVLDNVKNRMSSNVIKTSGSKTVIPIKSAS